MSPAAADEALKLPTALVSSTDVSRVIRELEMVDNDFEQQRVHAPGAALVVPSLSHSLAALSQDNNVNLADDTARLALRKWMLTIKNSAPVLHVTFASDAEPEIVGEIVGWIREKLHPLALVTTGVQPNLVGGCVVRTPDHIYDFSLRERFHSHRSSFVEALNVALAKTPYIPEQPAVETVAAPAESEAAGGK
jgi:hypothetical protein